MQCYTAGMVVSAILSALLLVAPKQVSPVNFVVAFPGHANDSYILPLTAYDDIRHARDIIRIGSTEKICVCEITQGADGVNRNYIAPGQPLWSWHVSAFQGFAQTTAEILDGNPTQVEQNPGVWFDANGIGHIGFWAYTVTQELGPGPSTTPPPTPGSFSAVKLSAGTAKLTWTDGSTREDGFEVERQQSVNKFWMNDTMFNLAPNTTSFTDAPGTGTFQYRVRSYNAAGSSTWTAWKSVKL